MTSGDRPALWLVGRRVYAFIVTMSSSLTVRVPPPQVFLAGGFFIEAMLFRWARELGKGGGRRE